MSSSSFFYYFLSSCLLEPIVSFGDYSGMVNPRPLLMLIFDVGLMLVWLSFFLKGGFMLRLETYIGSSYILSILLALAVVMEGLLRFLNIGSSVMISSDASIFNLFLVGLGGLSSFTTNFDGFSTLFGFGSSKKSKLSLAVFEVLFTVDLLSPNPTFLLYFSSMSSIKSSN